MSRVQVPAADAPLVVIGASSATCRLGCQHRRPPHLCTFHRPPFPSTTSDVSKGAFAGKTCCQAMERCSDGGEDQGAEEAIWGQERSIITSVLERAVSRERLFLSAREMSTNTNAHRHTHQSALVARALLAPVLHLHRLAACAAAAQLRMVRLSHVSPAACAARQQQQPSCAYVGSYAYTSQH